MLVYTSVTKSYIPKARVLAKSVKKFHPNWHFVLLLSDTLPLNFDIQNEPFDEILTINKLNLPNLRSWMFSHAVVELCTAVKGPAAEIFASRTEVEKIMYLDPDIRVYSSLADLEARLDEKDILLTPHLLQFENNMEAVLDNEISALKHGIYNLGFFAAKSSGQGLEFIKWWSNRLYLFCRDDIPNGLFTDQRWCDLAPAFFSNLEIIRDPGCNVATWNIAHRPISKTASGEYYIRDTPLKFYHFTSFDNGNGLLMLEKYSDAKSIAHEIWSQYRRDLELEGQGLPDFSGWKYDRFDDGTKISDQSRILYRDRLDIQARFTDPYSSIEPSYSSWFKKRNGWLGRPYRFKEILIEIPIFIQRVYRKVLRDGLVAFVKSAFARFF